MKRLFKRYLPQPHTVTEHRSLRFLGSLIKNPNLFHLNKHSIARALFLGIFCAFIPLPVQMLLACLLAVLIHANLPLAVCTTWISNPLTYAPMYYFNYLVGAYILGIQAQGQDLLGALEHEVSQLPANWHSPSALWGQALSIWDRFSYIGTPLIVGSIITGLAAGLIAYISIRICWRIQVSRHWHRRRVKRKGSGKTS